VIECPLVDTADRLARFACVAIDEVFDEERDVVGTLAQGRHRNRKHVQPIKEIASERAGFDRRQQVAVGRGNDAHVDVNRSGPADALELAFLKNAQQRDLGLHRQFADFVEEDGSAVRQLEAAEAALRRPGECPFIVAKQLRRDQLARHRRTVYADERSGATCRPPMDRAGHKFLARAGLARNQHGGIGPGDFGHAAKHRLQRRRCPDDLLEHRGSVDLVPQYEVLFIELILQGAQLCLGPLSVGTDGAGSVRIPAAFCGTFGLKPSFGRVPAFPLSPMGTVAHLGPLTMSVRDAAVMMNVLKAPDARDWTSLPFDDADYTADLDAGVRGLRIAWSPTLGYARNVHGEVAACCAQAVAMLAQSGAVVEQIDPAIDDPLEITIGLWFVGAWTLWNTLTSEQQALADPDFAAQAQFGAAYSALDVQRLHVRRGALGSHMRQFMQRYDLLVTPTVAVPAFDAKPAGHAPMGPASMLGWTPFSYPFNLTQQPACSIPCGLTSEGLPIGLQIVGPMFGDALVLRAARAYESVRPIPRPPL